MTADGGERSFGAPRFDVVLRGYDRRQVDEHLSRLQRVLSRMRGDLEVARGQPPAAGPPGPSPTTGLPTAPGVRPRPTPRPRPDGAADPTAPDRDAPDVVGTFTDRMQTILQAAEDEAAEIRAKARSAARAEEQRVASARSSARADEEMARVSLTNLLRERDAVLADLTRVRGQLEALLSGPTARIAVPTQDTAATAAAARRDAGAGHPLPGTPTPPQVEAGAAADAQPAGSAVKATTVVAAAERTLVLEPAEIPADVVGDDDFLEDEIPQDDAPDPDDRAPEIAATDRAPEDPAPEDPVSEDPAPGDGTGDQDRTGRAPVANSR